MMSRLAASVAALGVAVLGIAACGHAGPVATAVADAKVSVTAGSSAHGLVIGDKAFSGMGRLAFVSGNRLYVLDGSVAGQPATLHPVPAGKVPGSPAWSPDGQWLAFLVGSPSADGAVTSGALWLAGADGQGAHQVLPEVGGFAWSPKTDELAAVTKGGKLFGVRPGQPVYPLFFAPALPDAAPAWSPDGSQVAVSEITVNSKKRFVSSAIDIVASTGGIAPSVLAFSRTDALIIDGWWSAANGNGLLAWSDPQDSASLEAGGLPLVSYPLDGGKRVTLARTLVQPSFTAQASGVPWVDTVMGGVTLVTGGDQYPWNAKTLTVCSVSGKCSPLLGQVGPVNLDPAWAPDAQNPTLAFVHGSMETTAGLSQHDLNAWYRTRKLWYQIATGGNQLPVNRAGTGVAAPTWSADDQDILYVRDNALWLIPLFTPSGYLSTAPALPVVSRLFAGDWPNFYGYTAWQSQFAWYS
jgi:dipeptidyl aminopeptidase/acylaminoacyl peptidase